MKSSTLENMRTEAGGFLFPHSFEARRDIAGYPARGNQVSGAYHDSSIELLQLYP